MIDFAALYSRDNRTKLLAVGAVLVAAIAILDAVTPNIPLGFLYLFPVLLVSGFLSRWEIIAVAALCTALTTIFSDYPLEEALSFSVMCWAGMSGTGLFVSEIVRGRQLALEHQEELRALVEGSPLAIMTFVPSGRILLANDAAQNLLAPGDLPISGQPIAEFLPILQTIVQEYGARAFRTELRCGGKRKNGETFLAGVWISTAQTSHGPLVAAIVVDLSQDLREREDESLQLLLMNAKILMGAMAHEVRNLCGAVRLTYKNLSRIQLLAENEDFRALGTLIEGLERLSSVDLQSEAHEASYVDLTSVLDEFRVLIEPGYRESGMEIIWQLPQDRPLARGERYGLLQVFLNLARNSQRAMKETKHKQLTIRSTVTDSSVVVRFEDTGTGVAHPENLFRPFQQGAAATGLGLYVSRAILKSFGGEIIYEPRSEGCCFVVVLQKASRSETSNG